MKNGTVLVVLSDTHIGSSTAVSPLHYTIHSRSKNEATNQIAAEVPEDEVTIPNSLVIAWISGGTAGTTYRVECLITTSAGRTDERSLWITVQER